ncbi:MAG: hypothetical protein CFE21_11455 [Bacteroidetes bacterium B1(2017)]|nr:MAG: hypothetical protein CFE21_11455 [Bacteroidetes bacterium B1(2017)]
MKKQLLLFKVALLFLLLSAVGNRALAQVNLAPSATATASTCNTGACSTLNDLNFGTCGSQQMWITSSATNPGSSIFIQFDWTTSQVINKLTIFNGEQNNRFLGGGTVQYWNTATSAWVTATTFTQTNMAVCSYDINFNPVSTTKIRIIDIVVTGTQSSNVNFREIQIWQGSISNDDIGVAAIDSPTTFCSNNQNIVARVVNFGKNQVANYNVNWSINGTAQTPVTSYAALDTAGGASANFAQVFLGNYTFPSGVNTTIKAWTSAPNGNSDTIRINDSTMVVKTPAISGNYTIGGTAGPSNFATFAAAISAMQLGGICGPIVFTVAPGTYATQVVIPDIAGASPVNTITFEGVSAATRIITANIASGGVVIMNASKYVTFRNFTVTNTNTGVSAGIAMVGSVRKINIQKNIVNVFINATTGSSGYAIIATGSANGSGQTAMPGDSILIDSNVTTGGGYAITVYGSSSATANRGIVVTNNVCNNVNYMGGYIAYNYNPIVCKNNVFNMNGFQYGYYGLYFYYNQSSNTTISHELINNKINGFGGYGIYLYYPLQTTTAAKVKVYNNIVTSSVGGSYPGYYGIYLYNYAAACNVDIYHNTILMNGNGTSTTYTCLYNTGSSNVNIKNNIFAVYGGSYTPVYLATSPTGNVVNYNNYYNATNTTTGSLIYRNAVTYNPTNFKNAANGGDSSFSTNPSFTARLPLPGNLSLTDGCDGYGVDLTAIVPTDIIGATRNLTPNPGAYEFSGGTADNIRVTALLTPAPPIVAGSQDVKYLVKNIGNNTVTSYNASYRLGTGTPVTIVQTNTVGVCTTDTATFTGGNQITLGSVNNLAVYTDSPNGNPDADKTNDTLRTTLYAPLNGVYTVGGVTPDFATPALAAAALQYGVGGPVTFDIRPGTYTGQVVVNGPILGASDSIRVTFEGNSNTTRIITANVAGATFLMNNANYVTVQNLKIINTNTSTPVGIGAVGAGSSYATRGIKIRKCDVSVPIQSSTSSIGYGIIFTGTGGATAVSATGADSTEIDSNIVTGGGYSIVHYGCQNAAYNRGLKIRGNTINNCNYMGMYLYYNYNPVKLLNNTVNMQGQNYGYYGIYFYYNQSASTTESHEVIGNKILNFGGYGLYLYYPLQTTTAAKVKIYNNIIVGTSIGTSYPGYYGLYLYQYNAACNADVYHNDFIMNNGAASSTTYTGFYNTGSTVTNIKNNIFSVLAGSYTPMYLATNPTGNIVNYNIYYNAVSSTLLFRGATYTAATYKTATAGGDTSYNMVPPFVSSTNYQINNGCLRGADVTASVPTDIIGATRGIPGNIGAYEYPGVSVDITPTAVLAPSFPISLGYQDVRILVRNNGNTTITSFDLSYKLNGGTPVTTSFSGSLASCDTVSVYFTGSQQVNLVNASNTFRVYTGNPNSGADGYAANDTLDATLSTPMSGTYIIGTTAPSDFPTFNAAISAVSLRGVGGPIEFLVRTGTYVESFSIPTWTGTSPTNTVTFRSMANNADSVNVAPLAADPYIVRLAGANYTTFKYLTFTSNSTTSSQNGFNISGSNWVDSVNYCKIMMAIQTSYTNYLVYGTGLTESVNGIAFTNNTMNGSYYGIYVYGSSTTSRFRNVSIISNNITNTYAYTFYSYYSSNLTFSKNTVAPSSLYSGNINYYMYADSLTITNNKWNFTNNCTMYLGYYSNNSAGRRGIVANNVITGSLSMASPSIYLGYYSNYIDYLHNSINVPSSSQAAYVYNTGTSYVTYKNNVFANTSTGTAAYFSTIPTITAADVDYNNYFTAGASLISGASAQATLAGWRTACNCDRNSINFNPGFTAQTNLTPNATSANVWSVNGRANHSSVVATAANVANVIATDINGNPRPTTPASGVPDLGAYEVLPTSTPPLAVAVPTTPVAGGTQAFLFGTDTICRITYDAFTTAPSTMSVRVYTGTVPPSIAPATVYPYYYISVIAPTGTYAYNVTMKYKAPWIGNISSESALKLGYKTPTGAWTALTSSSSVVDSTALKSISTLIQLYDLPAIFTAVDDLNPLPVTLARFAGKKVDNNANLSWSTASEKNSSHFMVERSYDGKNFKGVGKVASNGNSNVLNNYSFVDENVFATSNIAYYRLKMVDNDGSFDYSNVIVINSQEVVTTSSDVKVYPNPFNDKVYVELNLESNETIEVRDLSGRLVYSQDLSAANQLHELNLPSDLNKGIYFLVIGSNQQKVSKLMKN